MPADSRNWDVGQEHMDASLYARYHKNVWMPSWVLEAAKRFLPEKGTELLLSKHYREVAAKRRNLPVSLYMPMRYDIVDVTVVREAEAIFRVLIRAPFNRRIDIGMVLEGDFEVVTCYWHNPKDQHDTLDVSVYEQPQEEADYHCTIDSGLEEMRKQSRPDDQT